MPFKEMVLCPGAECPLGHSPGRGEARLAKSVSGPRRPKRAALKPAKCPRSSEETGFDWKAYY